MSKKNANAATANWVDRRSHKRHEVSYVAMLEQMGQSYSVQLADVSEKGARVVLEETFTGNSQVTTQLAIAIEGRIYRAEFKIAWQAKSEMGLSLQDNEGEWEKAFPLLIADKN